MVLRERIAWGRDLEIIVYLQSITVLNPVRISVAGCVHACKQYSFLLKLKVHQGGNFANFSDFGYTKALTTP